MVGSTTGEERGSDEGDLVDIMYTVFFPIGGSASVGCPSKEGSSPDRPPGAFISFFQIMHVFHPQEEIRRRYGQFEDILKAMEEQDGGIENFALGHKTFGPQVDDCDNQIVVTSLFSKDLI